MALSWPAKAPDERLDYRIDWSARLGDDDTIASSLWIVPDDLTAETPTIEADDTMTQIWLSDGVLGVTYQIVNRVTTAVGRIMDQTMKLKIKVK